MSKLCDECALRLYNSKSYNLPGIGNPFYGNVIVIPSVDYKAAKSGSLNFSTQVSHIKDTIPFTGDLDSSFYITSLIKCNIPKHLCPLNNDIIIRCKKQLVNEIYKYDFKNILLLGDAVEMFLNVDIRDNLDTIFLDNLGRRYFVNYCSTHPSISHYYHQFIKYLQKWYNSINSGMYDYNIVML